MADKQIKPIKLCVNITIPSIDDDSISLYEAVGILANKMQEAIKEINAALETVAGAYSEDNPPPYPVKSVNGMTGNVVISLPDNVYTSDNPPPYPVKSVNRAETKDVVTVFEPEGGGIEDLSQAELIAACKAGARLGAFNQDDGTCRLYHFNLFSSPERVEYSEIAGGSASGVVSVNDQTGAVNIFEAPINAAKAEQIKQLRETNPYNLLDNSDFVSPVFQLPMNSWHGSANYAIDRWNLTKGATVSQVADGLKIVSDKTSWTAGIQQRIEAKRFADVMTLAVRGVFPVACRLFVYIGNGTLNFGEAFFDGDAAERTLVLKLTKPEGLTGNEVVNVYISPDTESTGTAAVVRWAALYEGEYTADTIPPYVPKGYAAELAECKRYFQVVLTNKQTFPGYCVNGTAYCFIHIQTMRVAPTVNPTGKFYYTLGDKQNTSTENATPSKADTNQVVIKCVIPETNILTGVITPQGTIYITAEL
jgi:hypothetical protein|nr:MAG TPA: hypothetical protein [Caudoviricetes sp.]